MCGVLGDKNEREDPWGSCRPMTLVRPALDERVRTIEDRNWRSNEYECIDVCAELQSSTG